MKKIYALVFGLFSIFTFGQIKGTVTDANGEALAFVSIYIENTYIGTTTNENGKYELMYNGNKNVNIIYQYLGYKTQKNILNIDRFPFTNDVKLIEENYNLNEVVLIEGENPADIVIRNAVKSKKINSAKTDKFEADFYSRGIFRVKDVPEKIMGMKVRIEMNDSGADLDSTGSGIIYLSETVSKIKVEKPNKLKEEIIASKVAGEDNGFSYNTALNTNYDFYENYIDFEVNMVSPIADNTFSYYKFKLESTFYDDNNQLINKILVTPKRDKEPVFEGYIYIVEDSWAIYSVDLDIKGYRMQQPILETMKLTQNFSYNTTNKLWIKNVQTLDFLAGIFGVKFSGKFTHVFTNYNFKETFEPKTFGREIVSFAENANKKEDSYWTTNRQVPLSEEESTSYVRKDSVSTLRNSQKYLDSIDAKSNKFKIQDIVTGYTYKNSFKKSRFSYDGVLNIGSISYNTVQGYNMNSGFSYSKYNEENGKYTSLSSTFNYGLAEDRLRVEGRIYHRFNAQNYANIAVAGGSSINQFNAAEPISKLVNSVSTLFFTNNFMKLYNKEFVEAMYGQETINGLYISGKVGYENRRPLFNNTDRKLFKSNDTYSSNDPLQPNNFTSTPFVAHHLYKASVGARIRFGQKYITRPDRKITVSNNDYPVVYLGYQKAFSGSDDKYNYDLLNATLDFDKKLGNKGDFSIRMKAGKFFNADNISFIDYKHFNGNQTHVVLDGSYMNSFGLLPYYSNSTNDAYIETHIDHNFKGYIMNKIPLLNKLQWNLIGGFHQINVPNVKPYQEFSAGFDNIGIGKLRIFRISYVRAYQNGYQGDGVVFGIKM
ncbi:DUF5686 and carboxypeptidase regulatory-like domain-containing protein [uncultured Flavobacterium sp.]|uniref:DUF5686 and carboxypeptidase regulatory-like domain-containing protein n=1 Tax=uncultured Flavobacterium sp. TaxID=165435 RepID=UPI0030EC53CD|tara:strand:- start:39900 stop:42377 length:2478 start_codon:yes stop_codon:yes gene_type:complete